MTDTTSGTSGTLGTLGTLGTSLQTADPTADPLSTPVDSLRARLAVVAVVLALGAVVTAGLGLWHPVPDDNDQFGYSLVEPMRTEWWAWHLLGGIGVAVSTIAAGLGVCQLATRRGAALATTGAVITSLGGLAFAVGIAGEGILFAYATDTDALSEETGRQLVTYVNDNPELFVVAVGPGGILMTLGAVLLAVALWRARSVPIWIPIAFGITNLAGFLAPFGPVATVVNLGFSAVLLTIAWYVWQSRNQLALT